jgi:glycosyltransferase involved in cell wall biosynthesis
MYDTALDEQKRPSTSDTLNVLIVAEHASLKFGGEAALPFLYFRLLREKNINVWMCIHGRNKSELKELLSEEDFQRLFFVEDTFLHLALWRLSRFLPRRISNFTIGFAMRLLTQSTHKQVAQDLIKQHGITVVHQPIPVSPKEPSLLYGLGVPVVIGPMNGGMRYPKDFRKSISRYFQWLIPISNAMAQGMNYLLPGKLQAEVLLYANERTKKALPSNTKGKLIELVENGVDFGVWKHHDKFASDVLSQHAEAPAKLAAEIPKTDKSLNGEESYVRFIFAGRLVDWKGVNFLLEAFKRVTAVVPARLEIVGSGAELESLQQQANSLFGDDNDVIDFMGWLTQSECAERLVMSDIFVLPSIFECGGAVVLEAMAMGLPIIATNWGGPADYIDETCGILVDPSSKDDFVSGLSEAMIWLAQNPQKRRAMGQAGYDRARQHFDWEQKISKIVDIYTELSYVSS